MTILWGKFMKIDMEFIKKEIHDQIKDKLDNMCFAEISEELYEFLKDKTKNICDSVYEILNNNEYVLGDCCKAKDGFSEELILDWSYIALQKGKEREKEIQSTILYNYDALWMTAIHKAFPNNTTNVRCGYGTMELIK